MGRARATNKSDCVSMYFASGAYKLHRHVDALMSELGVAVPTLQTIEAVRHHGPTNLSADGLTHEAREAVAKRYSEDACFPGL